MEKKEKRKQGGQPGNKNNEKWTKKKAVALGQELIEWLDISMLDKTKVRNIFYQQFLLERGLYKELVSRLCARHAEFKQLIEQAKQIQETKLLMLGSLGKLRDAVVIFTLKNNHGYSDKTEVRETGPPRKVQVFKLDDGVDIEF